MKVPPVRMLDLVGVVGVGSGVMARRGRRWREGMRVERGEGGDRVVVQRGYGLGVQGEQGVAGERLGVESGICRDGGGRVAEVVGEER